MKDTKRKDWDLSGWDFAAY